MMDWRRWASLLVHLGTTKSTHEIGARESPTEAYENLQRIMRDRRLR